MRGIFAPASLFRVCLPPSIHGRPWWQCFQDNLSLARGTDATGGDTIAVVQHLAVRRQDFESLNIFVYDLDSSHHVGLASMMTEKGRQDGSTCDFMQQACTESAWAGRSSAHRQTGSEVIILNKLLSGLNNGFAKKVTAASEAMAPCHHGLFMKGRYLHLFMPMIMDVHIRGVQIARHARKPNVF